MAKQLKLKEMTNILFNLNILATVALAAAYFHPSSARSFNFSDFSSDHISDNMTFERSTVRDGSIVLLEVDFAAARAMYSRPVRVWDNETGRVTDFATRFAFTIDSDGSSRYGDGMTFFLAPRGILRDIDDTRGRSLGLVYANGTVKASDSKSFVAVEFDIYSNWFDPAGEHVGIDVGSFVSVANMTWLCNVRGGKRNVALVVYDSTKQELSINVTGFVDGLVVVWQVLRHKVDLKTVLPEEVNVGFSAASGAAMAKFMVHSWDFESTLPDRPSLVVVPRVKGKSSLGLVLGLGVGGFLSVSGLCLILYCFLVRKKRKNGRGRIDETTDKYWDDEFQKGTGPRKYTLGELVIATGGFGEESKLGQGGFGGVYKGFLKDLEAYVAVKKVSKGSSQGMKEYATEVKIIGKLRHRNLVQLVGWCHEKGDLLLVYDYMPNGSLDSHLFDTNYPTVNLENRHKIARGLASALLYLHEEWDQCVIHRDIKSSNVMLDSSFEAKLGDFGLAKLVDHSRGSGTVTNVAGTRGYIAPEYITTSTASKETDIYSFGVVCLELACGRKPINSSAPEDQVEMVKWVWNLYGDGRAHEAVDPRLREMDFDEEAQRVIERLMVVGLWCANPDHTMRPSISQVIQVLASKNELPSLPPKMPPPKMLVPASAVPSPNCSSATISCGSLSAGR